LKLSKDISNKNSGGEEKEIRIAEYGRAWHISNQRDNVKQIDY
jgi:hypothetical protein